jgi:hypothetical protein
MNQHIIVLEISMVAPLEMWWKREEPRRLIVSSDMIPSYHLITSLERRLIVVKCTAGEDVM